MRVPIAVGVKVTLTVQLAPAINGDPQLLVWAKSPDAATLLRETLLLPVLVYVSD